MENAENSPGDDRRNDDPSAGAHGSDEGRSGGVGERVERMSGTAHDAWEAARQSVTDLRDRLDIGGRVERNPFGMVAAAVGVGYVLGGGIFTPLTGRIVRVAFRMALRAAAIPFIEDQLTALLEAARGAGGTEGEGSGGGGRRPRPRSRNENQGRQP